MPWGCDSNLTRQFLTSMFRDCFEKSRRSHFLELSPNQSTTSFDAWIRKRKQSFTFLRWQLLGPMTQEFMGYAAAKSCNLIRFYKFLAVEWPQSHGAGFSCQMLLARVFFPNWTKTEAFANDPWRKPGSHPGGKFNAITNTPMNRYWQSKKNFASGHYTWLCCRLHRHFVTGGTVMR